MTPEGLPQPADRIYCCRSLRLDQVAVVGFDLDYTLAPYEQAEMDQATVAATLRRLVERGYPAELAELSCPHDFATRGLLVDVHRGNVLKMDRYRYVKVAYHGLRRLSREERRELYEARPRPGTEPFRWVDTLYGLSDVAVYATVLDALETADAPVDLRSSLDASTTTCAPPPTRPTARGRSTAGSWPTSTASCAATRRCPPRCTACAAPASAVPPDERAGRHL